MARDVRPQSNFEHAYLRDLVVKEMLITDLLPLNRRTRRHRKKQIQQIAKSIETLGFLNPVLIDDDNRVIAGFGRVMAAEVLGMISVPTIRLSGLSEAQLRAYAIADNKLAELGEWDHEILAIEFQYIVELDIDFDLTVTGFETPEIDLVIGDAALEEPEPPIPPLDDKDVVSRVGDLWHLDRHRVLCGDARDASSYQALMHGALASLIITDPPYNQKISSLVGKGAIKHREFAMASGEMSDDEFAAFLAEVMSRCIETSADGSLHFMFMDWKGIGRLLACGERLYTELKNVCVWDKGRGGMGSLYRSQHELVTTSVGGALTGRGAGYIIVDDPIKPQDALSPAIRNTTNQWYDNTLRSRLDNKNTGVIILVMQRTHQDDLVGHVLEKEHWEEISLPAIAERDECFTIGHGVDVGRKKGEALHPERESLEILEQILMHKMVGEFRHLILRRPLFSVSRTSLKMRPDGSGCLIIGTGQWRRSKRRAGMRRGC